MRILFVNHKCGFFGGVEQNVAVTVKALRQSGHDCFLSYGESSRNFEDYKSFFNAVFRCDEIIAQGDRSQAVSFENLLRSVTPDVIYIHKTPQTDFLLPFINKIRIVRMVHDHDLCCPRRHKYFFHNARICKHRTDWRCYLDLAFLQRGSEFLNRFKFVSIPGKWQEMRRNYNWDSLLVGSRFMEQELVMNGFPPEKIHIVPPSVPLKPDRITDPSLNPSILCVSQLMRGKGIDLLLHALSRLKVDFTATIVGTGNAEGNLKKLCHRLGLDDRVKFAGWVDNTAIGSFYSESRVVAVPSRWPEPFGMIGLEAMRHARPVVAFDVGGIPDWLENEVTGLLVPEQDQDAFAMALEKILLDHNLAKKLGQAALKRALEKFSFEEFMNSIVKYLRIN